MINLSKSNSYNPAVKGSAARNHLKMEMLNSIISVIGEKWTRKETIY